MTKDYMRNEVAGGTLYNLEDEPGPKFFGGVQTRFRYLPTTVSVASVGDPVAVMVLKRKPPTETV